MELPTHPQRDDDQESATTVNWTGVVLVALVFAVAATLVILHLTGVVGPAGD